MRALRHPERRLRSAYISEMAPDTLNRLLLDHLDAR
jgi:hypothetical protein